MRGSSLAHPSVVETLRPFIVTSWNGRSANDMPDDVRRVYEQGNFRTPQTNIALFVLDAEGRVLRSMMPVVRPGAYAFDPEGLGRSFKQQLDQLLAGLKLPAPPATTRITLPDLPAGTVGSAEAQPAGVRIILSFSQNHINHYRTPVVEVVPMTPELRQSLRYQAQARELDAAALRPWLEQMFPPAVMDGRGGFREISGRLRWAPAGAEGDFRHATVQGQVHFVLDNTNRTEYNGTLSVALSYQKNSAEIESVRGALDAVFPRQGPEGRVNETVRMLAAIESRPR